MVKVYVPCDSCALSLGSESVAREVSRVAGQRGLDVTLVRNGSRGLYWLEPLVEVETPEGRIAFGPVTVKDVESLFDQGFLSGGQHPLSSNEREYIK